MRSPDDQEDAFKKGYSKLRYGFHNVTAADGTREALAVDMLDDDNPRRMSTHYFVRLARAAEDQGLETGIRWGLTRRLIIAVNAAIAEKDWLAAIKVGWDPTHVQTSGVTVAAARRGVRPVGG